MKDGLSGWVQAVVAVTLLLGAIAGMYTVLNTRISDNTLISDGNSYAISQGEDKIEGIRKEVSDLRVHVAVQEERTDSLKEALNNNTEAMEELKRVTTEFSNTVARLEAERD